MYRTSFTRLFDLDLVGFDGARRSVSVGSGALLFVAGFLHPFLDFGRRTRQGLLSLQRRLDLPAKNSVQIEIVAFTEPHPVTFPDHADSTFVSARLFPGSCLSASRDSCSPTSASGLATFEPRFISSVSVGLIESCGFGSRGFG